MNMAKEIYVTFRYVRNIDGELLNIYDGVFGSERDAMLQLVETYGNDWYAQGYRKLKQYIPKY